MSTSGSPSPRGFALVNGTMPEWSRRAERNPVLDFVDYSLRGVGQVVFMNNPITGLAILVAMWIASAWLGFGGTLGLVASTLTALILGMDRPAIRAGLYGFNGVLVGAALATFLSPEWSAGVMGYIVAVSAFSTILMATLAKIFLGTWGVPPFTLPFNFATLIFLVAALQFKFGHVGSLIGPDSPAVAGQAVPTGLRETVTSASVIDVEGVYNAIFRGIGQLFFADKPLSGVIMIAGIAVCSRIAAVFALIGSTVGMLTAFVVGANGFAIYHGLWGVQLVRRVPGRRRCLLRADLALGAARRRLRDRHRDPLRRHRLAVRPLGPARADVAVLLRDAGLRAPEGHEQPADPDRGRGHHHAGGAPEASPRRAL